ncbi:MAG TPA: prephenate dehydratase [Bacteroidota bacterium]|nr:prephenate dehydratase [Bacteroidota bacterium]
MNRTSNIAYQGEPGAFSEEAAAIYFGKSIRTTPCKSFTDVFRGVERKRCDFGIIPIENSLFGSIHENYDLLQRHSLFITGEVKLRVVHSLLANKGVTLKNVRYIYSHPQAIGQCDRFLGSVPRVESVAMYDTAGAAKFIKNERRLDAAAIASARAAKIYGLNILRRGIENDHTNFTRFLVLSRKHSSPKKRAKTSIVFSMNDIPGALFKALSVFAMRDINLHKIESRPLVGKPWEYLFYVDFEGSLDSERAKNSLRHLEEITAYLRVLGSYEEAPNPSL